MTQTRPGTALTELVLDLFRLNSRLLTAGDRMVADLGLTSARWQVLGAIVAAERSQPVAWIARDLGGNRQNVQRIVNDLHEAGLVAFAPNPHHRRAQLVVVTEAGRAAYDRAMALWMPWADGLAEGHTVAEIETMGKVIRGLRRRLEERQESEEG